MKPRIDTHRRLPWGWQLLLLALAWFPASQVVAGNPPPPPGVQAQPPTLAPARPAAGQATLYSQFDFPSSAGIVAQDSTNNSYDTRAADDFFVAPGSNSWEITAVEVAGFFSGGNGPKTVSSVNIEFFTDLAGKPGQSLASFSSVPTSGTDSTGNFLLPLSSPMALASDGNYWVTVQAVQSTPWYWYWKQRTPQSQAAAVWQNPSNGFGRGCLDWTAITNCYSDTGYDLLFGLNGNLSANRVTPLLISLEPNHGFNRDIMLSANGAGFANGAVLNWTLGSTQQFTTTFIHAGRLSAVIPAAAVSSYGATVTVSVTNPGPCTGSCTSNTLTFVVNNPLYLPLIQR